MTLPLHAYLKSFGSVDIIADNAKSHTSPHGSSRKHKDRTSRFERERAVVRIGSLPFSSGPPQGDRWGSAPPVKPMKRPLKVMSTLDGNNANVTNCVLDKADVYQAKSLDSSPTKPTRMTFGLADCAQLSLSMPRRPLRKPFLDISVVKGDRFEGTTADMISKVLEELELPDSDDEQEDEGGSLISSDSLSESSIVA